MKTFIKALPLCALIIAQPVLAQTQTDITINAQIIEPEEEATITIVEEPDFGQVARPREGQCVYGMTNLLGGFFNVEGSADATARGCTGSSETFTPGEITINCTSNGQIAFSGSLDETTSRGLAVTISDANDTGFETSCDGSDTALLFQVSLTVTDKAELGTAALKVPVDFTFE